MKIAAFTASKDYAPARFRVRQLLPVLQANGIEVREFIAPIYKHLVPRSQSQLLLRAIRYARPLSLIPQVAASHAYDASWIQREFIWSQDSLERFTGRPRLFDVDDAIWLDRPDAAKNMARLASRMDVIIAGNRVIADWFGRFSRDTRVIHTGIDTTRFVPSSNPDSASFSMVWTGHEVTLRHLYVIEEVLENFLKVHVDAELIVVCNRAPEFKHLRSDRVRFVPWSPATEVEAVQYGTVGLMPLVDDEHSRAKCSFKMLQYMACELPVVVTPIGLNNEILNRGRVGFAARTDTDWFSALECLYADRHAAALMGKEGRRIAKTHFGHDVVGAQLADLFTEVVSGGIRS